MLPLPTSCQKVFGDKLPPRILYGAGRSSVLTQKIIVIRALLNLYRLRHADGIKRFDIGIVFVKLNAPHHKLRFHLVNIGVDLAKQFCQARGILHGRQ